MSSEHAQRSATKKTDERTTPRNREPTLSSEMRCCRASLFPEHRRGSQWSKSCAERLSNATSSEQLGETDPHRYWHRDYDICGKGYERRGRQKERKVHYLIQGDVALRPPHPPHRQARCQCSRTGSTHLRSRMLGGCDGFEGLLLFPSFRRCVASGRACPWPYCREVFTIKSRGNRPRPRNFYRLSFKST
jgi:hypothetical protein